MKKENIGSEDPQSLDNRRLSAIARNPNHPMHTHAKAELERRRMKTSEGAMKRIATTQASKTDRMASTDKKGLETFKKKPVEEKTLTPAELKKREKIAKAIERDNPDMPMDKKMAIATATAKRVAESKDDEYHKTLSQTKNSYEGIAALKKKHGMSHTKAVATISRLMKDSKPEKKLKDTSGRKADRSWAKSKEFDWHANMDEGKVDELKKSTLASYIKKASDDRAKNAYDIGKSGKINYKGLKRRQGINRAVNKMAAESTLDRIKKILDR